LKGRLTGKLLTIWAINRVIDPESGTQRERWVPTTDIPYLAGIPAKEFTKDAFLSALDFVYINIPLRILSTMEAVTVHQP